MTHWKELATPYFKVAFGCALWPIGVFLIARLRDFLCALSPGMSIDTGRVLFTVMCEGLSGLMGLLLFRYLDKRPMKAFGFHFSREARRVTAYSILIMVTSMAVFMMTTQVFKVVRWHAFFVHQIGLPMLEIIFVGGVMPGIGEEFFFRGYVFRSLKEQNIFAAYGFSALFFAAVHFTLRQFSIVNFVHFLVAGLLFAFLFEKTNSIWSGVIVHAANNALSFLLFRNSMGISIFYLEILMGVREWSNLIMAAFTGMNLMIMGFLALRIRSKNSRPGVTLQ